MFKNPIKNTFSPTFFTQKVVLNKYFWLVAGLTAVGFYLRLLYHYSLGSFWFDEYYTVYLTEFSLGKMLSLLPYDYNLPFYHIILWFWERVFGDSELAVRMFSIILGVINIPLFYVVGKKLFSKKTAIIGIIFYTLSSYQIYHTTEARGYSLLIFLALTSVWFFWRLFQGNNSKITLLGYFVSTLLLAYTHLTGLIFIFAQFIFIVSRNFRQPKKILPWLGVYTGVALLFLPYLLIYYFSKGESVFSAYLFYIDYNPFFFINFFKTLFNNVSVNFFTELFFLSFPLFILASFTQLHRKQGEPGWNIEFKFTPAFVFSTVVITIMAVGCFLLHWITPRYLIIISLFLYLMIGEGIFNWFNYKRIFIIITIIFIIIVMSSDYRNFFVDQSEWARVADCINSISKSDGASQPKTKIIVHHFTMEIMLKKYYTGNLPFEGFYPLENNLSFEERLLRDSARPVVTKENVNKLSEAVTSYDQIILVESIYVPVIDPEKKVAHWFVNNGWRLEDKFCQIGKNKVYSFIKD